MSAHTVFYSTEIRENMTSSLIVGKHMRLLLSLQAIQDKLILIHENDHRSYKPIFNNFSVLSVMKNSIAILNTVFMLGS